MPEKNETPEVPVEVPMVDVQQVSRIVEVCATELKTHFGNVLNKIIGDHNPVHVNMQLLGLATVVNSSIDGQTAKMLSSIKLLMAKKQADDNKNEVM